MSDIRNEHLEKIINMIFSKKSTAINEGKKQVVIGGGRYAKKCSFLETDKEYYINLLKYTFLVRETKFVDKDFTIHTRFNRQIAVKNAIKYLKSIGIDINCKLYCDSERTLLASYVHHVLKDMLFSMFFFGKDFDERKYTKLRDKVKARYHKEIVTKDITTLIYANAKWSDVELFKENEDSSDCLLIDNGSDWRNHYLICCVNTGLKLQINSDGDIPFHSGITFNCDKIYELQNNPVPMRKENFRYLDFFHLDYEYYVPNRFCYCTNLKSKPGEEKSETTKSVDCDEISSLAIEYSTHEHKNGSVEFEQARTYLQQTYCTNRKQQYMNTFAIITKILSILLCVNYREFYSDKYNISKTSFSMGFEQLKYFFEDKKIKCTSTELTAIYKYLITTWLDCFRNSLDLYNFEEMFKIYSEDNNNEKYKRNIEENRKTINRYKTLNIFDSADSYYKEFYERNIELIDSFKTKILYETHESFEQMVARKFNKEYNPFKLLKESIEMFKKKLEKKVPYYIRTTVVEGETKSEYVSVSPKYGYVGEVKTVNLIQDERYTVEETDHITLGFNDNIVRIKYELKPEYITEQPNKTLHHNIIEDSDDGIILKKNHKYRIEFEVCGNNEKPFSFLIVNKKTNGSLALVFEKNDIILTEKMQSYSFDFLYSGSSEDTCYLSFGYGNSLKGYSIRNLRVIKIN